jgi:two-component system cell cycle sensor histidine kinase/response regulator CckA
VAGKASGREEVRIKQDTLLEILKAIPGTLNVVDTDYNILAVGGEIARTFENVHRIIGKKCHKVFQKRDNPCPWCKVDRVIRVGDIINETTTPDDPREELVKKPLSVHLRPLRDKDGNIGGAIELGTDITQIRKADEERKRAEDALREQREELQIILDCVPVYIFSKDKDGRYIRVNKALAEACGIPEEQWEGKTISELLPNLAERCQKDDEEVIVSGQPKRTIIEPLETIRGTRWTQTDKIPRRDEDGNVVGLIGVSVDITERKLAREALQKARDELEQQVEERTAELSKANIQLKEEIEERKLAQKALKQSEARYRALFEATVDGILIADHETRKFRYANPAVCKMLCYNEEELRGMSVNDIHPKDSVENVISEFEATARGEKPCAPDIPCLRKDGAIIHVDINATTALIDGRKCAVAFFRDIAERKRAEKALQTAYNQAIVYAQELKGEIEEHNRAEEEKKRLEAQLLQAQKMESIGTLAGGVAHDFNNLLMGIQGYASLMLNDLDETHPHYHWAGRIEDLVRSGAGLTRQLLGFARGEKYDVRPTDINEIVKKSSSMFGRTRKEIIIQGKYEQDLWTVQVDRGQMGQVLLNLYVNAWHAMPAGGALYLETSNVSLDESHTKPYDLQPGRYVKISVTDTGTGMDEATQQRIFDPFFTTKQMGWGTGLGLASAYGIIKSHGGIINVFSEKGHGSTFNIYLPAVESVLDGKESAIREEEIQRGTETILLVDDEQTVVDVGRELLRTLGYKVLSAAGGQEALDVCQASKDEIDLVILDIIMPEMGGGEIYYRIKEINPDIKVLLSSGYSLEGKATELMERGCDGFIQKPFNMKKLSWKIRKILGKE